MHYNDQGADFKYLIVNERDKRFGLSVTTVGFQAIRAGSVYPPRPVCRHIQRADTFPVSRTVAYLCTAAKDRMERILHRF